MNRLIGLFVALLLGLAAQRILTGPQPGIPRDALILFILAAVIFVWNAQPPKPLREESAPIGRPWRRRGLLLSLAGLVVGLVALALLWQNLQSLPGLLLWPVAVVLFVAGTLLEDGGQVSRGGGQVSRVEGQVSRVEGQVSRVEDQVSRVEGQVSRVEGQVSRVEGQASRVEDQVSRGPESEQAGGVGGNQSPEAKWSGEGGGQEAEAEHVSRFPSGAAHFPVTLHASRFTFHVSLRNGTQSRFTLRSWASRHWDILLLVLILALAVFARFNRLDVYPNGCQSDECNNGLDALKWLAGQPYTPYAETNEGQATLFTYLIALSFRLLGVGVTQMRIVSAVVGVLTVVAFYVLARDLYGRRAGLVAAALLATARWHVTFSRIVYELILQPLAMVLLAFFLLRALREGRRRDWALAGLSLAFGMNTYTAFRVVPFIVAAFLLFWILRALFLGWLSRRSPAASKPTDPWRRNLLHDLAGMAVMAGGAFVAVLPLGIYTIQNWTVFTSRIQHISVMRDVEQVGTSQPIVDNLRKTLYMFNWRGDEAALNNLPGAPMLDTLVAVLLVLGLAFCLWYALRARPVPVLYVIWFAGIASLAVLSVAHEAPTARRTIGMLPLIYLMVALIADQFFTAWQRAWRGRGEYVFNAAVAIVVALVAFGDIRTYFTVQALDPSVWAAYSPNESAVGRYLTTLPTNAIVLITPQFQHHSAIKLIGREHPYRALNPVADLPFRDPASGDLVYVLDPVDKPLLNLLQQIYPAGSSEQHTDRYGQDLFLSFTVPQADLAATQGLVGQFFGSFPPTEAAEARQPVRELDVDLSQAPLAPPFFALWEGSLLVPQYGTYSFDVQAEGNAEGASLVIGRENAVDVQPDSTATMTATLAAGFHPLRVEYRSGAQPGRLRVTWSGPGFTDQPLGGDVLYAFRLGDQGLVGYYYPNGQWEGTPSLVRNDLLITPNNPLREPFSILWRGKIAIPQSGLYTFGTRSDDGSLVYIDGQLVVDNGGSHGAEDRQGNIQLEEGFHDIEVRYNELGGSREMQLWWQPPGQGRVVVDSKYLFPLEGEEVPAGLALPPPPEIAQLAHGLEPGAGEVAPAEEIPSNEPPSVQARGDLSLLPAQAIWEVGGCGTGAGQFNAPHGVALDAATGDVYVADSGNIRIVKLTTDGQWSMTWGQAGDAPEQFQEPADLVVEPSGTVLVLDAVNQRMSRWGGEGAFQTAFGDELAFYRPRGLGIDVGGGLAVADTGGIRIVRLDSNGTFLSQLGGQDSDLARKQPTDAVLAPTGDLYFVEAEDGAITRLAGDGSLSKWAGPMPASTIDGPHLAWRPAGGLYVTDPEGRRVLLFDPAGKPVGQFGAELGLMKPTGIAVVQGADGDRVVVADSQACRVVAFDLIAP